MPPRYNKGTRKQKTPSNPAARTHKNPRNPPARTPITPPPSSARTPRTPPTSHARTPPKNDTIDIPNRDKRKIYSIAFLKIPIDKTQPLEEEIKKKDDLYKIITGSSYNSEEISIDGITATIYWVPEDDYNANIGIGNTSLKYTDKLSIIQYNTTRNRDKTQMKIKTDNIIMNYDTANPIKIIDPKFNDEINKQTDLIMISYFIDALLNNKVTVESSAAPSAATPPATPPVAPAVSSATPPATPATPPAPSSATPPATPPAPSSATPPPATPPAPRPPRSSTPTTTQQIIWFDNNIYPIKVNNQAILVENLLTKDGSGSTYNLYINRAHCYIINYVKYNIIGIDDNKNILLTESFNDFTKTSININLIKITTYNKKIKILW